MPVSVILMNGNGHLPSTVRGTPCSEVLMDAKTKDCVFSVGLLLFGFFVVYEAVGMVELATKPPFNIAHLTISPGFLPLILGGALVVLALILLITSLANEAAPVAALVGHLRTCATILTGSLVDRGVLRVIGCVLIMAAYTFGVLGHVPFAVGAFAFLVILMYVLRAAPLWIVLATSAISVALIIGLFETIFKTTLP